MDRTLSPSARAVLIASTSSSVRGVLLGLPGFSTTSNPSSNVSGGDAWRVGDPWIHAESRRSSRRTRFRLGTLRTTPRTRLEPKPSSMLAEVRALSVSAGPGHAALHLLPVSSTPSASGARPCGSRSRPSSDSSTCARYLAPPRYLKVFRVVGFGPLLRQRHVDGCSGSLQSRSIGMTCRRFS